MLTTTNNKLEILHVPSTALYSVYIHCLMAYTAVSVSFSLSVCTLRYNGNYLHRGTFMARNVDIDFIHENTHATLYYPPPHLQHQLYNTDMYTSKHLTSLGEQGR